MGMIFQHEAGSCFMRIWTVILVPEAWKATQLAGDPKGCPDSPEVNASGGPP